MSGVGEEIGEFKKEQRNERFEKFQEEIMPKITELKIGNYEEDLYRVKLYLIDGVCFFYPKSDKVLICRDNKWISNGANWIKKNVINNQIYATGL